MRKRFLRWLFKAQNIRVKVDEPDWGLLAGMGLGATKGLKAAGITNYAEAKDACAAVAAATGAEYELDELVCFLCLTQHKEAAHASNLPKIPPPVSLRDDLGLELPTMPIAASPRLRITQKTKLARDIAPIMASVLLTIAPYTNAASDAILSQCCRSFSSYMAKTTANCKGTRQPKMQVLPESPSPKNKGFPLRSLRISRRPRDTSQQYAGFTIRKKYLTA